MSQLWRTPVKFLLDLAVWVLAAPLAYLIRLDVGFADYAADAVVYTAVATILKLALLLVSGLHRQTWHRVGLRDLRPVAFVVGGLAIVELVGGKLAGPLGLVVPRSVPFIEAMVAFLGIAGLRFAARLYYEERGLLRVRLRGGEARRVLVVGAGDAGQMIAREMQRHPEAGLRPVGFLDEDAARTGRTVAGLRVLGALDDLGRMAARHDADEVLIALPSARGREIRQIVEQAQVAGLAYRIIPPLHALASGEVTVSSLREVAVEDLLRRETVKLDPAPVRDLLAGRRVLVTGAGGSIGSEIARQVAVHGPANLLLLGRGENSIFEIDAELQRTHPLLDRRAIICDVRHEDDLRAVFEAHRPEVVFHAAAHKHVPMMEAHPDQAILNNIGGTEALVRLALEFGVERLVNVSTDKAVNPSSVMGASKRVAEGVVAMGAARCAPGKAMVSVRFGNVLGSRGSVVPTFQRQIAAGGPVTVTDPAMTRYFMTIPEASQLVLHASAIARNGRVYVLDMGQPVRIEDLARDLILLSGLQPGQDIEIEFTGARPGEKLFEELLTAEEGTEASSVDQIFVARNTDPAAGFEVGLAHLLAAARAKDAPAIRRLLADLVPHNTLGDALQEQLPERVPHEVVA